MKAVVAAFNQEKAIVGAFSVITNLRMDIFEALPLAVTVVISVLTGERISSAQHLTFSLHFIQTVTSEIYLADNIGPHFTVRISKFIFEYKTIMSDSQLF